MTDKHCLNPFTWLDISAWGHDSVKLSCCIESWGGSAARLAVLPFVEAAELNVNELWNGQRAQQIRHDAILGGRAEFCDGCPRWRGCLEPVCAGSLCETMTANQGPKVLNLAYDRSCNLHCPSCRTHTIFHAPGTELYGQIMRFQEQIIRPLLRTAERAFLAGLGDPFGSPCYRELLMTTAIGDAPSLKWYILTNGQGFTPDNYYAIPTHAQIDAVQFSIDAACKDTYLQNRQSNWERLIANLSFAGSLRRDGLIPKLEISMVVQWNNYKEIPAFIELGRVHSVDKVMFSALLPQGTYADADYLHRAVHLPIHSEHAETMRLLDEAKQCSFPQVTVEMPRC